MKKYWFLLVFISYVSVSNACDICSCGVGNYYLGLMPQYSKNFIGLRYRNLRFESHLSSRILRTKEYFHTTELLGRFYPTPKLQILTFLPYSFNYQTDINNLHKNLRGFNDMMFLASYNVLNRQIKGDTIPSKWKHSFWMGGGIKIPTGKYDYSEQDGSQVANANFQLGSGSFDFLFTAFYNLRYAKFGLNQDMGYKINTANPKNYRFGNRLSGNSTVFYIQQLGKNFALMPHIGIYYELSAQDERNNEIIAETGGSLLAVNFGLDWYAFKKVSVGVNTQMPIAQNLGDGEILAKNRWNLHFSVLF